MEFVPKLVWGLVLNEVKRNDKLIYALAKFFSLASELGGALEFEKDY